MNALKDFKEEFYIDFKEDIDKYSNFLHDFRQLAVYINEKYGNDGFEPINMSYVIEKENLFRKYLQEKSKQDKCINCDIYQTQKEKVLQSYNSVFDAGNEMHHFIEHCKKTCNH